MHAGNEERDPEHEFEDGARRLVRVLTDGEGGRAQHELSAHTTGCPSATPTANARALQRPPRLPSTTNVAPSATGLAPATNAYRRTWSGTEFMAGVARREAYA